MTADTCLRWSMRAASAVCGAALVVAHAADRVAQRIALRRVVLRKDREWRRRC